MVCNSRCLDYDYRLRLDVEK